ncbi:MAG: DUF4401 domain-containing protein [Gammaproteobacteria bacterium]
MNDLLNSWIKAKLVAASGRAQIEKFITSQSQELPMYIQTLLGIGTLGATILFLAFFHEIKLLDFKAANQLIISGVIFVGIALLIGKFISGGAVKRNLLTQVSFCIMFMGKILFMWGFALLFDTADGWGVTLAAAIITVATYYPYKVFIDRALSVLIVCLTLFLNIATSSQLSEHREIILNLYFFLQVALLALLFLYVKLRQDYVPFAYALLATICIEVLFLTLQPNISIGDNQFSLTTVNAILTVLTITLIASISGSIAKFKTEAPIVASLGAILLGIFATPAVIISICMMLLGHAKYEKPITILGIILMPVSIVLFYYNLNVSLLSKSEILVASGALLLVGSAYMSFRKFDREI